MASASPHSVPSGVPLRAARRALPCFGESAALEALCAQPGELLLDVAGGRFGVWEAGPPSPEGPVALVPRPPESVMPGGLTPGAARTEDLPMLPAARFDIVCVQVAPPALEDQPWLVAEARRTLKPGGRLIAAIEAVAAAAAGLDGPRLQRWLEDAALIGVRWEHIGNGLLVAIATKPSFS